MKSNKFLYSIIILLIASNFLTLYYARLKIIEMDLKISNQILFINEQENERNNLDIIARKIFDLLKNKDSNSLKDYLPKETEIDANGILFKNNQTSHFFSYTDSSVEVDYRQRFFEFNDDLTHYYTGYEMIINKSEVIPVIHLVFDKIDNKWILTDINTE